MGCNIYAIFVVVQLLPRFRCSRLVTSGVGCWYLITCTLQIVWTLAFAFEVMWLSLMFMYALWVSLAVILYRQYYIESDGSILEFWIIRFPFAVHSGWVTAATLLNTNVVVVAYGNSVPVELAVGIVSLAILYAATVFLLTVPRRPNYTICCVLSWATGAIAVELANTPESITERFSYDSIMGVRYAAAAVSVIIILQVTARVIYSFVERCTAPKKTGESATDHDE